MLNILADKYYCEHPCLKFIGKSERVEFWVVQLQNEEDE